MKRSLVWVSVFVAVLACVLIVYFQGRSSGPSDTDNSAGLPIDYFPMEVGTEWTYQITLGETEPMHYEEVGWPQPSGGTLHYAQRGFFYQAMVDDHPDSFLLKIKVDSVAEEQGPLSYPTGVKLAILQDDLGIFEYVSQLYWAVSDPRSEVTIIQQVCMYPPDTPGAPGGPWGSLGIEDGYSVRIILFGEEPGIGVSFEDSPDMLYFVGIDKDVPGYSDTICLHFKREVKLSEDDGSGAVLDKDFTEDTWFAKGIGLVLLEQKVMGQNSMTWRLQ